jgi:catechol 2,3-dioxygenase-like lactoylglutathione lyase family enzyme
MCGRLSIVPPTDLINWSSGRQKENHIVEWKLEVVTIPVSDLDRARDFYAEKLGFNVDIDQTVNDFRFLQLTPNGSKCSIHLRRASADRPAGSVRDLFLVVRDVRAARGYLVEQGVDIGEVQVFDSGEYRPARPGESLDMVGCAFFNDPDDNSWCVQQIPPRE